MNFALPPQLPPVPFTAEDDSHLNLLGIFHFVMAGLSLLGLGFLVLHGTMMFSMFMMVERGEFEAGREVPTSERGVDVNPKIMPGVERPLEAEAAGELGKVAPRVDRVRDHMEIPPQFKAMLAGFYFFFAVLLVVFGVLELLAGLYLRKKKNRTFCMVIGGLNCLQVPLGTVLGIFTLVVLSKPQVKAEFERAGVR